MLRSGLRLARVLAAPSRTVACKARSFSTTPSLFQSVKYAKSHEWALNKGGIATVGISDHAQSALGDLVFVELPEVGEKVSAGKTVAAVESVKAAADVYSPVSGEVVEVNSKLADTPDLINKSPMQDGWIVKVKISDANELNNLLDEAAYAKHCEESDH